MEKLYCPYCGRSLSEGCDCEAEAAEEAARIVEDLEERQMENAWQEDLIFLHRMER